MDYDIEIEVPAEYREFSFSLDDRALAWKFLGGYRFNEYFGAEVGYIDAGKGSFDLSGFTFGAVVGYPVTSEVTIFLKGGGFTWRASAEDHKDTDFNYAASLGMIYRAQDRLRFRAEWERLSVNGSINFLSLGLQYHF